MDLQDVLKQKAPQRRSTEVLLDPGLLEERDRLVLELKRQERAEELTGDVDWRSPVSSLRDQLAGVEESIRASTVTFTFEAVPRPVWSRIVADHLDDDGETLSEEFMIQVVAASLVEPPGDVSTVRGMFEQWSTTDTDQLYLTAFAANREARSIPFTEADTGTTPTIGLKSTTAESEGSLIPNS